MQPPFNKGVERSKKRVLQAHGKVLQRISFFGVQQHANQAVHLRVRPGRGAYLLPYSVDGRDQVSRKTPGTLGQ